ncbi:MAG TPA: hypothetical protein VFM05_08650, partial [Candidatus Saccharimonadales bacterium]|nr:hypothetical protein [Candidatus Saccharimonadales bacterium]
HQDLERFFDKKSNMPKPEETSLLDKLFPKAYAHDGHDHEAEEATIISATGQEGEELQRLNNLIGSVVIFVQKDKPSAKDVEARFADLAPLGESTCAG